HAVVRNGEEELYDPVVTIDESSLDEDGGLEAPVEAGQAVGQITLTYSGDGETAYLYEDQQGGTTLVTDADVERAGWFSLLMRGIGGFFSNVWSAAADTVRGWFS
ncbi:D-alanyl-D-alanine carboxypeptidase, partial [Halalkalibacterium halodurans]|nr:D-alanyl-D-alanine carboxypeptidase [Halalkalibacterium halodurans]